MTPQFYTAGGITAEFGLEAETSLSFLLESFSYDVTTEKAEIYDESGDLVHTHRYNKKASISLSGIGTEAPQVGSIITSLINTAGGQLGGTILIDQVVKTKSSSDFQKVEISATQYDTNLTLVG
jgi:hypothetical protein